MFEIVVFFFFKFFCKWLHEISYFQLMYIIFTFQFFCMMLREAGCPACSPLNTPLSDWGNSVSLLWGVLFLKLTLAFPLAAASFPPVNMVCYHNALIRSHTCHPCHLWGESQHGNRDKLAAVKDNIRPYVKKSMCVQCKSTSHGLMHS